MSDTFTGVIASLRRLGHNLLGAVHDHVELVAIELQEEKLRLIQIFLWISAAVISGMLAIAFLSLTIVYLCPERARPAVLAGLTLLYLAACLAIVLTLRRRLERQPNPFAATVREIARDRACMDPDS